MTMAELLRMPEVAAGVESVVLSSWSVAQDEAFSEKDVIAVLETDKAVVDVEAESDGVVLRKLVVEGADVPVGDPIALVARPGDPTVTDIDALLSELGYGAPSAPSTQQASDSSADAGIDQAALMHEPTSTDDTPVGSVPSGRVFASPLARRLARQSGLAIADIAGTGPGGRIIRRDVERALGEDAGVPEQAQPLPRAASAETPPTMARMPSEAGFSDIPHTRLRRSIAARLTESKQTAPHFYVRGTAHVDRLLQLREEINTGEAARISVNDLVVKAVARAHLIVPALNVIWTADAVRMFDGVDIGVAIATDTGLVAPVLRSVESMSIREISATVRDYSARAKEGRLQQHELIGGSVSVTNLGMIGTEEFSAIINPPHATILAVGAARQEPIVLHGEIAVGTVMRVTLSVDHRPVDGLDAATWMKTFIGLLECPAKILA
jgi:pyruvate dehydrogenase E2 component (dihydrolipoamide acetyltransferase)